MKTLPMALMVSAIGLSFVFAAPAEAAKSSKHKKSGGASHAVQHRQTAAVSPARGGPLQAGVLSGPLYNGQDYLGDDPDPNIRAYLLKDMTRYRGGI
jgi:hypothetical protein